MAWKVSLKKGLSALLSTSELLLRCQLDLQLTIWLDMKLAAVQSYFQIRWLCSIGDVDLHLNPSECRGMIML